MMRLFLFSSVLLLNALLLCCKGEAQTPVKAIGKNGSSAIEVIDFHTTHRCKTCLAIENAAKNVLQTQFAKEMQAGKIVFKTINVDETANAQLAEKYEASGSALFIYNGKTGNAVDLTDFAFMYCLSNENKFKETFKAEVQKSLNTK